MAAGSIVVKTTSGGLPAGVRLRATVCPYDADWRCSTGGAGPPAARYAASMPRVRHDWNAGRAASSTETLRSSRFMSPLRSKCS